MSLNKNKEVKKLQKDLREKLKKINVDMRISTKAKINKKVQELGENEHIITVSNYEFKMKSQAIMHDSFLTCRSVDIEHTGYGNIITIEEVFNEIIHYWKSVSLIMDAKIVTMNEPYYEKKFTPKIESEKYFHVAGFKVIDEKFSIGLQEHEWFLEPSKTHTRKAYILENDILFSESLVAIAKTLHENIKDELSKESTSFMRAIKRSVKSNEKLAIGFYYDGYEENISFLVKESKFYLEAFTRGEIIEVRNRDEVTLFVNETFEYAKSAVKLKNLITPPRTHFDNRVSNMLSLFYGHDSQDLVESIYNFLVEKYDERQVEEWCATQPYGRRIEERDIRLIKFMDYILVFNKNEEYFPFLIRDKENAYAKYEELLWKTYYQVEVRKKIDEFEKYNTLT